MKIGKEREFKFTLKALQEINKKYGSLEGMKNALQTAESQLSVIDDLVWLITLLVNQAILSKNLDIDDGLIQGDKEKVITEEYVSLKIKPGQIGEIKDGIFKAIIDGSEMTVNPDENIDEDLVEIEKNA